MLKVADFLLQLFDESITNVLLEYLKFVLCPVWQRHDIDLNVDLSFMLNKKENIFLKNEADRRL